MLEKEEILYINEDIINGTTIIFKEFKNIDPIKLKELYIFIPNIALDWSKIMPAIKPANKENNIILDDGKFSIIIYHKFSVYILILDCSRKLWIVEYKIVFTYSLLNILSRDFLLNFESPGIILSSNINS